MDYLQILNDHSPPLRVKYVMHKETSEKSSR